ncbi:MAG UNVERIFIED_CONTAM: hypothetical protein LVR18_17150 [Planctomycetaceae bacterium]|jgi:chemotaxis protein histidine kinase CheA
MTSADSQPQDDNTFLSAEMAQYLQVYIDESDEELEGLTEAILQLEKIPATRNRSTAPFACCTP